MAKGGKWSKRLMESLMKNVGPGVGAGAAQPYAAAVEPTYGPPAATIGIGIATDNETLQTVGGFQLGTRLAGRLLPGAGGGAPGDYL